MLSDCSVHLRKKCLEFTRFAINSYSLWDRKKFLGFHNKLPTVDLNFVLKSAVEYMSPGLRATPNRANIEPRFCSLLPNYCCLDLFIHSRTAPYGRKLGWIRHKVFNRSTVSRNRGGLVVLLKPVLSESSKWFKEAKEHERTSPKVNCPYRTGIKYMSRELIKLFCCSLITPIWVEKLQHIVSDFFCAQ